MKLSGAWPVFFYCRLFGFAICFSYDSLTMLKISLGELLMVLFMVNKLQTAEFLIMFSLQAID